MSKNLIFIILFFLLCLSGYSQGRRAKYALIGQYSTPLLDISSTHKEGYGMGLGFYKDEVDFKFLNVVLGQLALYTFPGRPSYVNSNFNFNDTLKNSLKETPPTHWVVLFGFGFFKEVTNMYLLGFSTGIGFGNNKEAQGYLTFDNLFRLHKKFLLNHSIGVAPLYSNDGSFKYGLIANISIIYVFEKRLGESRFLP